MSVPPIHVNLVDNEKDNQVSSTATTPQLNDPSYLLEYQRTPAGRKRNNDKRYRKLPTRSMSRTPVISKRTSTIRKSKFRLTRMGNKQPKLHRACDKHDIYYIDNGKRCNYGTLEYLTWVSDDDKIGERVSDDRLEKMCHSYANGTAAVGNNHGGKRKTRKVRRSRK